jgi:acyl-CoA synthetase (NDP forming)
MVTRVCTNRGVFFNTVISYGNEADLGSVELLEYLADDPNTQVVGMYMEGIKDGVRLREALWRCSIKKPVIVWKAGRTASGAQAASSHTGSLAGEYALAQTLFRQTGVSQVQNLEEMSDTIVAFSCLSLAPGRRIAIVSGPGGLAVGASDACEGYGLSLAKISRATRERLATKIPPTGTSLNNPIDVGLTAAFTIDIYTESIHHLGHDPGVDAVMVIGRAMNPEANRFFTNVMLKAAALLLSCPEIEELELNPLFLYPKGAMAVDARVSLS